MERHGPAGQRAPKLLAPRSSPGSCPRFATPDPGGPV